jgi:hypothetical protein
MIILAASLAFVGLVSLFAWLFVPKGSQNAVGWGAIGICVVAGYAAGWTRATEKKDHTPSAVSSPRSAGRTAALRAVHFIDDWVFIGGLVAWAWDSHSPMRPWIRLGGALCFLVDLGAGYVLRRLKGATKERKRGPIGMNAVWSLALAYAISSPLPGETQPRWLTAAGVVFVVLLVFGAIPAAVIEYRNRRDEREMAIATRSLSFAFIVTMIVVLAFSMLETLKVGPTLRANYIIGVAASSWFASWFVLRRRM